MKKIISCFLAILMCSSIVVSINAITTTDNKIDMKESGFEYSPTLSREYLKSESKYERLIGRDRILTSVKVSEKSYLDGANTAIIVNGFIYADSISAIPVSAKVDGPILLTSGKLLEKEILEELHRLKVGRVIVIGGESSVSDLIVKSIEAEKLTVTRLSGANRYKTNQAVTKYIFGKVDFDEAVFVSGENFADSISSGVLSYKNRIPIVLIPSKLDRDILDYIGMIDVNNPILIGGTRYLPIELDSIMKGGSRYAGKNRYDTSHIINTTFFNKVDNLLITTGESFADALSGVPYAGKKGASLVLYDLNPATYVNVDKYRNVTCLGGRISSKLKNNFIRKTIYNKDYVRSADTIVTGKIPRFNNSNEYLKYSGSYANYKNETRGLRRHLYSFFFLNDLVNAYEDTGNRKYIEKGMDMIADFESYQERSDDEMVWHDETTARRLDSYLRFYSVANFMVSSSNKHILNTAMYRMASKMSYTDFWAGNYNHGLFQDMAVMRYANFSNNEQMFKLAESRAANYFDSYFDSEGVHSENSPEYHFVMLKELRDFMEDASGGDVGIYGVIKNKYENSKRFSDAIILPNKLLPVIGDTGKIEPVWEDFYATSRPEYTYNLTRNTFKHSGYDIAKSKNSYLLLRGGYLTNIHHHDDDLSFWLYKNGNIFTEVGAFGYEYSNPLTQYIKTFKAHNSLVVDSDVDYKGQGMDVQLIGGDKNNMGGISRRTKNSEFSRNINFDDNLTQVKITDNIHSTDGAGHLYELYFHLDPSIDVSMANNIVILRRNGQEIGKFTSSGIIRLEKDIYCQDYSSGVQETNVLVVTERGVDVKVDTNISLN